MRQAEAIYKYNYDNRPKFNKELFIRQDDDIINALKDVILSCERQSTFTIKVRDFEVIDDYDDINHILWSYEDSLINKNKKTDEEVKTSVSKKQENPYEFINLKDSDIKLLKVTYYIGIIEKKDGYVDDIVTVYIAVPRIVDKFYFRINGNAYSAMYQIVDASTYNNSASKNAKKVSITFKTAFMPIRVYKYLSSIKDIDGESIKCTYFLGNMFKKSLLLMKYILAKLGYYGTKTFLNVPSLVITKDISNVNKDECYIFPAKDSYVVISKFIYDNSIVSQSLVYTILHVINYTKDYVFDDLFGTSLWVKSLGMEFTTKDLSAIYSKGLSILDSLEFIYDKGTRDDLKLDDNDKADIYRVLRWMMYEFNALRQKDNLDISTKKVRYAEYIAALYAAKLAAGIYRVSDKADKADLVTIKKAIQIPPMYLLNALTKCQLVNYKDSVNDIDSLTALKYTYKGVSGIGESSNAISAAYRSIHPSHLGRVDIDSSSNSDPGVSGTLCPFSTLHNLHFIEFKEPSTWESDVNKMINQYRSINNKVEVCRLIKDNNLSNKQTDDKIFKECASVNKDLMKMATIVSNTTEYINGYDMFGNGIMYILHE